MDEITLERLHHGHISHDILEQIKKLVLELTEKKYKISLKTIEEIVSHQNIHVLLAKRHNVIVGMIIGTIVQLLRFHYMSGLGLKSTIQMCTD
jgi:hypothetical protein